jgi:trimeric autotransporter adhesin
VTPTFSDFYSAQYSGDQNFPGAQTAGLVASVTVVGNNFSLLTLPQQGSLTVQPGQVGSLELLAGLQNGAAPVSFASNACSGLPSESTCSISPNPVTGTGGFVVQITTTAPGAAMKSRIASGKLWFETAGSVVIGGLFILGLPATRRRRGLTLLLPVLLCLLLVPACGGGGGNGGGGGGGGGNPGTPAGTYAITITATSGTGSTEITQTVTFNLIVQ